jgi:hypothetical protein
MVPYIFPNLCHERKYKAARDQGALIGIGVRHSKPQSSPKSDQRRGSSFVGED